MRHLITLGAMAGALLAPNAFARDMRGMYAIGGTIGFNGQLNASADGGMHGAGAACQMDFMAGIAPQWEIGLGVGASGGDTAVYDPTYAARELARLDTVGFVPYLSPAMTCVPIEVRVRGRLNPLGVLNPYATVGLGLALFTDNNNSNDGYDYYGHSYSNFASHTYVRGSASLAAGIDLAVAGPLSVQVGGALHAFYDNPFGSSPTVKTPPQFDIHVGVTYYGGMGRGRGMMGHGGGPSDY